MTNILFIHQNYPGQYRRLSNHLLTQPDFKVAAIGQKHAPGLPGVMMANYNFDTPQGKSDNPFMRELDNALFNGKGALEGLALLRKNGFEPDIVFAHPAWGESIFLKDALPRVPLIHFCEFFYRYEGADCCFDPEFPLGSSDTETRMRVRQRNALHLLNINACDLGISPTRWQKSVFPEEYLPKIRVLHEGIDVETLAPPPRPELKLPDGRVLTPDDEVITYVSRNLEPYRGFHIFMRAAAEIQRRRPKAHVVFAGGDDVSYGRRLPPPETWRERMLKEVTIDPARTHFLGVVPYATYKSILHVSSAHVYLTYPFVLSWSMLEAMAAGCLLIGSDTAPVREVISDGKNGLLVDFFSVKGIADRVDEVLCHPDRMAAIRKAAREHVAHRYDVRDAIAAYRALIHEFVV
jgi:glycosyltransferase involved in cell wall biosynthesis